MSTTGGKAAPSKRAGRAKGPNRGQVKTKIVIRRLPANLPEHVFMDSIKTLAPETSLERPTTWVSGKVSKNPVKGNTFARAYIYFKNEKIALEFQRAYHGHVFMDKNGNEGRAYVEFAPFQKIPRDQRKADAKQGTIEEDPEYVAFLQSLNAEPVEAEKEMKLSGTELLLKETAVNPKSTPLLEALRAQKAAAQAKAQAAKIAARQARQAGKAGASNTTKGQITILVNRNAKEIANSRAQPSGASASANKNQQGQQGKTVSQQAETENGQGSKPKRERRRRDRASKKAATDAASGAAGDTAATPQVTLLKPKPASNAPAPTPLQNASNNTESRQPNNTPSHGNQGPSSSSSRRGHQNQNQGGQQQQQQQGGAASNSTAAAKKDGVQTTNAEGTQGRSGKSRRNRGDRAKQDPKVAGGGNTVIGNTSNSNSNNNNNNNNNGNNNGNSSGPTTSGNKGLEGQGGGGSNRQGRSRRGRGGGGGGGSGGQENPSGPSVQG
ncbi:hypothetical protein BGX26_011095 [Mortierella sp. AD094]|nr:hypothetical protein BGX26_011095 [Mortierella sp. AD094]